MANEFFKSENYNNKTFAPQYIGDDGKIYPSPEALEEANKTYWENWKILNESGRMKDSSHLKALDGSYHSNPESIKEANRKFREAYAKQMEGLNSKRIELVHQLLGNPSYALDCAGLKFIKQIHLIYPQLTQDILELMLEATKNNDFENLEPKFIGMLSSKTDLQESKQR